jgi:predicted nucleic acid-binding protein
MRSSLVLADTNILSTFAKVKRGALLVELFGLGRIGLTPVVFEELQIGVSRGYVLLQSVIDLVQQGQLLLIVPNADEVIQKSTLPASFDLGERETLLVAKSRAYGVLTNESHVKHWCRREQVELWDLPGILRSLWRNNVMPREDVRNLIEEIEQSDRVVFKNKENILAE